MSSCGLLFVFIYSSAAVFTIVGGQSTTDDSQNDVDVPIVEQLLTLRAEFNNLKAKQARTIATLQAKVETLETRLYSVTVDNNHTIATLQAEVETLKARQSSMTVDNRKLFFIKLCFAVTTDLISLSSSCVVLTHIRPLSCGAMHDVMFFINVCLAACSSNADVCFSFMFYIFELLPNLDLRLSAHGVVMMSLTCTLQKQAELLTSVGDNLVVKTMVPRFSTKVVTPLNYSCVMQTYFVEYLANKMYYMCTSLATDSV